MLTLCIYFVLSILNLVLKKLSKNKSVETNKIKLLKRKKVNKRESLGNKRYCRVI